VSPAVCRRGLAQVGAVHVCHAAPPHGCPPCWLQVPHRRRQQVSERPALACLCTRTHTLMKWSHRPGCIHEGSSNRQVLLASDAADAMAALTKSLHTSQVEDVSRFDAVYIPGDTAHPLLAQRVDDDDDRYCAVCYGLTPCHSPTDSCAAAAPYVGGHGAMMDLPNDPSTQRALVMIHLRPAVLTPTCLKQTGSVHAGMSRCSSHGDKRC
jgi:hypothetical protein